jgi:hypothetical protein
MAGRVEAFEARRSDHAQATLWKPKIGQPALGSQRRDCAEVSITQDSA